jgi:hypothetical protein
MNWKLVAILLLLCGCASTPEDTSDIERLEEPALGYLDESLCSLRARADQNDLWGDLIRVEGTYRTDRQTYSWVKGQCKKGEIGGIEFARLLSLNAPGLERMANSEKRRCGNEAFCAYVARVVVVGRLMKDESESTMYGMQLELIEVQRFEIIDDN